MTPAFEVAAGGITWAPSWAALGALAVLTIVVAVSAARAWRRLARAGAFRRVAVAGLNVLALLAMGALLAPPGWEGPAEGRVSLVTEGALAGPDGTGASFALGGTSAPEGVRVTRLRTAGQLALRRPDLGRLEVLGHGLAAEEWASLPPALDVHFEPPPLAGVAEVSWPRHLALGSALVVTGVLRLPDGDAVAELRLLDPAGLAVAAASARSGQTFALEAVPRAPGALTYRLEVRRGDTVWADEPVTLQVRPNRGARLLVFQSAPSFETRRLAAWAGDRGYPLVIQSRISRDRELAQGVNLPPEADLEVGPALLARTDLAIVDGRRWANLDPARRGLVLDAVRDGMGLLLLADEALAGWLKNAPEPEWAGLRLAPEPDPAAAWPRLTGPAPDRPLARAPWRLEPANPARPAVALPLTLDEDGTVLEAWRPLGKGRVAVSLLRERHGWATSGADAPFARYWTRLMHAVGRPENAPRWHPPDDRVLARPGERQTVCAAGAEERRFRATPSTGRGAPSEGALTPHGSGAPLACGFWWPATAGWHRLDLLGPAGVVSDTLHLRVFAAEEWRTTERAQRQAATLARAAQAPAGTAAAPRRVRTRLSPWWPWGLLLLSGGLLWIERRLHDMA